MADSIVFMKCSLEEAIRNYKEVISGGTLSKVENEENEEVYKYDDVYIFSLSEEWTAIETEEGDDFGPDVLLEIAKDKKCIYTYVDEDLLDGELIVIEKGEIIRKLFDYYTTPELNENFGKIEYEDEQEISDWIDIGQYMDYLLSSL